VDTDGKGIGDACEKKQSNDTDTGADKQKMPQKLVPVRNLFEFMKRKFFCLVIK